MNHFLEVSRRQTRKHSKDLNQVTALAAGSLLKWSSNGSLLAFLSPWGWITCSATTSLPGVLSHLHSTRDLGCMVLNRLQYQGSSSELAATKFHYSRSDFCSHVVVGTYRTSLNCWCATSEGPSWVDCCKTICACRVESERVLFSAGKKLYVIPKGLKKKKNWPTPCLPVGKNLRQGSGSRINPQGSRCWWIKYTIT